MTDKEIQDFSKELLIKFTLSGFNYDEIKFLLKCIEENLEKSDLKEEVEEKLKENNNEQ